MILLADKRAQAGTDDRTNVPFFNAYIQVSKLHRVSLDCTCWDVINHNNHCARLQPKSGHASD